MAMLSIFLPLPALLHGRHLRSPPPVCQANSPPVNIRVFGIGGGGGNAVNRMVEALGPDGGSECVDFVACNTDVQALARSLAPHVIQLGDESTRGLGAGGQPEMGMLAAVESSDTIRALVEGRDMVFVTAGMGGGTGSGAAPVVAQLAREAGALTVGVVSKPFAFEGRKRLVQADEAVETLRASVDVLIVVSNDRLLDIVPAGMSLQDSFALADEVLRQGIVGLTDLVTKPGLVNVDFADVTLSRSEREPTLSRLRGGSACGAAADALGRACARARVLCERRCDRSCANLALH
jgi:cell division protein FtsZ